ncbi:hypothetical protein M8C13_32560 [Crossiella sp. SN42]|uniref:hypothetical protein n=1 Tax=Crossiella sp. SN42 TaxID=2944808 RepID=UPI00207CB9CE|nr:hypothetical protein [Crossiella sp. SN42]MCO1580497.1 hypothetical protein [Crossiella sp. SN42]
MTAALRMELLRLRRDLTLLGFLVYAALTTAISVLTGKAAPGVTFPVVCLQTALLTAFYGAVRFTIAYRHGVVARALLLARRGPVLCATTCTTAIGGAVIMFVAFGAGALALLARTGALTGVATGLLAVLPAGLLLSAVLASWGLLVGTIVRHHVLAPLATAVSLFAPLLIPWPEIRRVFPAGSTMSLLGLSEHPWLVPAAVTVLLGWLLALALLASGLFQVGDLK